MNVPRERAANTILLPKLGRVLPEYPDVKVEIVVDYGLTDIVASRYDAGVRLGEQVARGMIAVPIGPEMRMAAVASPAYFAKHAPPKTPRDLTGHCCINIWLPTAGGLYVWEFENRNRELRVRVEGQVIVNGIDESISAALAGLGITFALDDTILEHVRAGRLVRVLEDWTPPFPGYHLYYPTRRQASAAFSPPRADSIDLGRRALLHCLVWTHMVERRHPVNASEARYLGDVEQAGRVQPCPSSWSWPARGQHGADDGPLARVDQYDPGAAGDVGDKLHERRNESLPGQRFGINTTSPARMPVQLSP